MLSSWRSSIANEAEKIGLQLFEPTLIVKSQSLVSTCIEIVAHEEGSSLELLIDVCNWLNFNR